MQLKNLVGKARRVRGRTLLKESKALEAELLSLGVKSFSLDSLVISRKQKRLDRYFSFHISYSWKLDCFPDLEGDTPSSKVRLILNLKLALNMAGR